MVESMNTAERVAALGPDVTDHRLTRPDGRIVAWSEAAVPDGRPVLRIPGTPGSRLSLRADRQAWVDRGLRLIMTERPGYGASTRLEGRGFDEHADDLAAILDGLGIDTVPVVGGSGAAPHILAFVARHPDRVLAATIVVGAAPIEPEEAEHMIELNALGYRLYHEGDFAQLWRINEEVREQMLADPLASIRSVMSSAPAADQEIMADPAWQATFAIGLTEALEQGSGGWYDEGLAMEGPWGIGIEDIRTDITWWHGDGDRNAPLSAARRLVDRLPNARLRIWHEAGHFTPYRHEPEILDELLARCSGVSG
jgi:pimeloyl-ACP methyl ester carboxylesterase